VLRDVWAEHVLFATAAPLRVAGFIDLHAAGVDSPATDIARLLGSWRPDAIGGGFFEAWAGAIAAYEARRPLAAAERHAIPLLHAAGVVFGLDNWFRWVLEEGRTFPDPDAVLRRADRLLAALPPALQELATIATVSESGAI
jgi:Ser/Thr protein kinase RdoA (MazF antagonist)